MQKISWAVVAMVCIALPAPAAIIESTSTAVQGRDGVGGREFTVTFHIPDLSGTDDVTLALLQCDGAFLDGIGLSAVFIGSGSAAPPASFSGSGDIVKAILAGDALTGETLNGSLEVILTPMVLEFLNSNEYIHVLFRPLPLSRQASAQIETFLPSARLVLVTDDALQE
jgi:hypothetical protein